MSFAANRAVTVSRSAAAISSILEERKAGRLLDGFVHPDLWDDEELLGRARFQILFGVLGGLSGVAFAAFYFAIGHFYGGVIIGTSSLLTTLVPFLIRKSGNLKATGYLYGFVLLMGFTGLCAVGGGVSGYSVAWLASVPLAVLLLVDLRGALTWTAVAFATVLALAICEMVGYRFPTLYDESWASAVASISSVGLVSFLAVLGLSFENTRSEAFRRMRLANQRLEASNGALACRNDEKNSFLGVAAHGLREPLERICEHADRLRQAELPGRAEVHRRADDILLSAGRSLNRVDRLLDLASMDEGRTGLKEEPVDVAHVARNVLTYFSERANERGIALKLTDDDEQLPAKIKGDATTLFQILENLISNAIEHSPVGGEVEVRIGRDRSWVMIEVCDEGPGLPSDHGAKLFRKVAHSGNDDPVAGAVGSGSEMGLGLWIVRSLTEAMGGTVFCRSDNGAGSAFGLRLSLAAESVSDQKASSSIPRARASATPAKSPPEVTPVAFPVTYSSSVNAPSAAAFLPGDPLIGRLRQPEKSASQSGGAGVIADGRSVNREIREHRAGDSVEPDGSVELPG